MTAPIPFTCCECGRALTRRGGTFGAGPVICVACVLAPGWFRDPDTRAALDPRHDGLETCDRAATSQALAARTCRPDVGPAPPVPAETRAALDVLAERFQLAAGGPPTAVAPGARAADVRLAALLILRIEARDRAAGAGP